jgi:hypothetical protein
MTISAQPAAAIIPRPAYAGTKIGMTYPTMTRSTATAMPGHSRSGLRTVGSLVFIQIASGAVTPSLVREIRLRQKRHGQMGHDRERRAWVLA